MIDATGPSFERANRSQEMHLIHQELARGRLLERQQEAEAHRRALRVAAARRWQRRAEAASRRARAAAAAIR